MNGEKSTAEQWEAMSWETMKTKLSRKGQEKSFLVIL